MYVLARNGFRGGAKCECAAHMNGIERVMGSMRKYHDRYTPARVGRLA